MRPLVLLAVLCLPALRLSSQTTTFSQFYNLRTALNPAYVSAAEGVEVLAGYRRQWGQVQGGFQTAYAAAAVRSCHLPLAFGAYASDLHEPFFGYRQQEMGAQLGGFFGPGGDEWSMHAGAQAGLGQHRVDYDRLVFSSQLDPLFGQVGSPVPFFQSDGSRVQTFDMGLGGVLRGPLKVGKKYALPASVGFAIHHLVGGQDVSFLRLGQGQVTRYTTHLAIAFPVSNHFRTETVLYVNTLLRMEWESALQRSTAGLIFQYDAVNFGLLYQSNRNPLALRNTNTLSLVLGGHFPLGKAAQCRLQYSFDGALSGLGQAASGGAHELTATFVFPGACVLRGINDQGRGRRGKTNCFQFAGQGYSGFF